MWGKDARKKLIPKSGEEDEPKTILRPWKEVEKTTRGQRWTLRRDRDVRCLQAAIGLFIISLPWPCDISHRYPFITSVLSLSLFF